MLRHLTFANVCSTLALVVALGSGTAYAANTVRSKDIVNGQVKAPDLGKNAVTSTRIRDSQVTQADLAAGAVTGAKVADGSITLADLAAGTVPPPTTIGDGSITTTKLANGSVSAPKLQTDSVGASAIADNSIDGGELVDNSIFSTDLGADSVAASELANNAVDGANVINDSLTFSDIDGGSASGSISLGAGTISNGRCENITISIGGASVGDAVVFSVQDALPEGVLLYGVRVTATNSMTALACNFTGGAMPAVTDVAVRILTFH